MHAHVGRLSETSDGSSKSYSVVSWLCSVRAASLSGIQVVGRKHELAYSGADEHSARRQAAAHGRRIAARSIGDVSTASTPPGEQLGIPGIPKL